MDKFRSVLRNMGIELEFIQPSQPDDKSLSAKSPSVQSLSGAASPDQTGTFPISPNYNGRRRRNSDTSAAPGRGEGIHFFPTRSRSVSSTDPKLPEPISPVDPARPDILLPSRASGASHVPGTREADAGGPWLPQLPVRPRHSAPLVPAAGGYLRGPHFDHTTPDSRPESVGDWRTERHDVGRSRHWSVSPYVDDASERFLAASETTERTSDDLPPYPMLEEKETAALERRVQDLLSKERLILLARATVTWRRGALHAWRTSSIAFELDARAILCEALGIWRENSAAANQGRHETAGPVVDPAELERLESRADRAHDLILLHKAFTHWQACSRDESSRTAVARRHILRKRCFSAWRAQQSADEEKVHRFQLQRIFRVWSRASIHEDVRSQLSSQRYQYDLVKTVFQGWRYEYLARLADALRTCRAKERYLATWLSETREAAAVWAGCAIYDDRLLLGDALTTWRVEYDETHMLMHGCMRQKTTLDCRRVLEEWRSETALQRLLTSYTEARAWKTKKGVITAWTSAFDKEQQGASAAQERFLRQHVVRWRDEAKLKLFKCSADENLMSNSIRQWRLAQKLAAYKRSSEQKSKWHALAQFRAVSGAAKSASAPKRELADHLAVQGLEISVLETWWDALGNAARCYNRAAGLSSYNSATYYLQIWSIRQAKASARTARYEEWAIMGNYYCTTSTTLSQWSATANQARKERLTRAYHAAKRRYKANLATRCLSRWRRATGNVSALEWYADNAWANQARRQLGDALRHWNSCSQKTLVVREVAAGAELEVYWGLWSLRASQLEDAALYATDYSSAQALARCWRSWEFSALQCKGRQHTVITLREKHDKKLCRQVLALWSRETEPGGALRDLRSSAVSRRSLLFGGVRQSIFSQAPETPSLSKSAIRPPQLRSQQPTRGANEGELPATATNASLSGFGRTPDPPRPPYSRELGRDTLFRPGARDPQSGRNHGIAVSHDQPPQRTPSLMKYSDPYAARSLYDSSTTLPVETSSYRGTPGVSVRGFGSPGQPQPLSDFDLEPFSPEEANDPGFMSTPTRWVSSTAQQQHQQYEPRPTTTPSAILSTPYEKALREKYGRLENLAASRRSLGRATARETPRVTFADIREESGEYEERSHD